MTVFRFRRDVALVCASAVVLAGCSDSGDTNHERAEVSEQPSPTPGVATAGPGSWREVAGPIEGFPSFRAVGTTYVLVVSSDDFVERLDYVTLSGTYHLDANEGHIIQDAWVDEGTVLFGVGDDLSGEFWVKRWYPESGAVEDVYASEGPDADWSETAMVGQTLYITAHPSDTEACVNAIPVVERDDVAEMREVYCVRAGADLGWLVASGDTVSFMTWVDGAECPQLFSFDAESEVVEGRSLGSCAVRAIASQDVVVWNEAPASSPSGSINLFETRLRATYAGIAYDLGEAAAGSMTICDGTVYWLQSKGSGDSHSFVWSWEPGAEPVVVYRSPDDADSGKSYVMGRPYCGDGVVFAQFSGDAAQTLVTSDALEWSPDIEGFFVNR